MVTKNNHLQEKKNMIVYHYCSLESLNSYFEKSFPPSDKIS